MRFIVDECTGHAVACWLREQGHEVFSVYEKARGSGDGEIIQKAFEENWILLTNDKDFGEKVYRERLPHNGVILLRLVDERTHNKIRVIRQTIKDYAEQIADHFLVVTETQVRLARKIR
ncbi:DUF5615 family PIN-like protein [bacterium]|nr:DUF5615 family PIN-like protein [bacterium]MBU1754389.1 DUF5615 family PIN-like protein [bacterium]